MVRLPRTTTGAPRGARHTTLRGRNEKSDRGVDPTCAAAATAARAGPTRAWGVAGCYYSARGAARPTAAGSVHGTVGRRAACRAVRAAEAQALPDPGSGLIGCSGGGHGRDGQTDDQNACDDNDDEGPVTYPHAASLVPRCRDRGRHEPGLLSSFPAFYRKDCKEAVKIVRWTDLSVCSDRREYEITIGPPTGPRGGKMAWTI